MVRYYEIKEGAPRDVYDTMFPPASCQEINKSYFDALTKYFKTGNVLVKWVEGKSFKVVNGRVNILVSGVNA